MPDITVYERTAIIVVSSLFCLHMMRNLTPIIPIAAWAAAGLGVLYFGRWKQFDIWGLMVSAFVAVSMAYAIAISFLWFPEEAYFVAIVRFLFMTPFAIFVSLVVDTRAKLRCLLQTLTVWVAIGALTILYQVVFGPIGWFALPTERIGTIRFASLLGSVTTMGIVGGISLPIAYLAFSSSTMRGVLLGAITIGMVLSLSKAAMANVVIFSVLMLVVLAASSQTRRYLLDLRAFLIAAATFVLFALPSYFIEPVAPKGLASNLLPGQEIVDDLPVRSSVTFIPVAKGFLYQWGIFQKAGTGAAASHDVPLDSDVAPLNNDVSVAVGIKDRLIKLPGELLDIYGSLGIMAGVGLVGGSGGLGFLHHTCLDERLLETCRITYPMAHNAFIELAALGGLPLLLSVIILLAMTIWKISKKLRVGVIDPLSIGIVLSLILFVANAMMGAGILYQPYISAFLYSLALPLCIRRELL